MKERDGCRSNDSLKIHKGKLKKYNSPPKLFVRSYWPKVMISREDRMCKKVETPSGTTSLSFLEGSTSKLQAEEKEREAIYDVEHLYHEKNETNFEEEQDVCLISSSSERDPEEILTENEKDLKKISKPVQQNSLDCFAVEGMISGTDEEEKPIFVDLTTDEKNTWKQNILKRFCDTNTVARVNEEEDRNENSFHTNVTLEPRIMIADSSNKLNRNESSSLTTALRDRGPCLIPVQPNHSLPIRPAPLLPTRSFRKNCSSLPLSSKSTSIDIIEDESFKSIDILSNHEVVEEEGVISEKQMYSKHSANSLDNILPQISIIGNFSGIKKKFNDGMKYEKDNVKENKKKRRSQEADSSQNREESSEDSIKEFFKNFCAANEAEEIQNSHADIHGGVVSTTNKESGDKLVPPLRLKKVVRSATKTEACSSSQIITDAEDELNYRIVKSTTPKSQDNSISIGWTNMLYEKDTILASLKTDSHKLKYRRNRLKQKLRELRGKALELAKQMANDSSSQQNTRLRQMMNRYEKQIENLSKLHSKLSANLSISNERIDMSVDEHLFANINETNKKVAKNNSPVSSPEPPQLSPRSPANYENILPEEVRNSPPTLSRVCLTISSSQDSINEDLNVPERKIWSLNKDLMKSSSADSSQSNSVDEASPNFQEAVKTTYEIQKNDINFDVRDSDLNLDKKLLSNPQKFLQNNETVREKQEKNKVTEEFLSIKCHKYSDSEPIVSSVINNLEAAANIRADEKFESTSNRHIPSPKEHVSQLNSRRSNQNDVSFEKVSENNRSVQKVTSTSSQSTLLDFIGTSSKQEHYSVPQNYKGAKVSNDSAQRNDNNYAITEQFPTLGNWVARMSEKQTSKSKSKLQTKGNVPCAPMEHARRISRPETQKTIGPSGTNDITNATIKSNIDRWQYYSHQQQRQQQLLQHVAGSVSPLQPIPTVPSFRSGVYPPIPMSQFYPTNYAIDPCNGAALSYHPVICSYGNYSYHSRLHPSSLSGYHFSVQESLRHLQHTDKRFPFIQEPIIKYPSPSTNNLQQSSNVDFDRLRGSSVDNNIGVVTSLPSLFLPPPSLSSSQQTLPRAPVSAYSTNNQFSGNRMIPDVVAAAAAAAVVAAASFDRQHDVLTCNSTNTVDTINVIDGETRVTDSDKIVNNQNITNQTQDISFGGERHEKSAKYKQMQNFLFDRSPVKTTDSFTQASSVVDNVKHSGMMNTTPMMSRKMSLLSPQPTQLSKNTSDSEIRNCETPHLGKVNRSPNSLHKLVCSNCGVIEPKFKCLGCEMAFYCNERCQEKHWDVHVQWCPKKMPKLKKVT